MAAHFGFAHLDTGLLYRAVALTVIDSGHSLDDHQAAAQAASSLIADRLADPRLRARRRAKAQTPADAVAARQPTAQEFMGEVQ